MSEPYSLPNRDEADAKAWFYLDHRGDIETWAALRAEGAELLERYMMALLPALSDLAVELGAEPYESDVESGSWPRFGLTKHAWRFHGHQDIAVAVEWERGKLLRGTQRPWPYVGVRLSPTQADSERRAAVTSAVAQTRNAFNGKGSSNWPVWAYITPSAGTGINVDPAELANQSWLRLRHLWELVAPPLDRLHAL